MTSTAVTALAARRARIAVILFFTINGLLPAAWIARLVDIQQDAGLSDASLGLVLASGAAGGLALGLLASPLVARWGSARVAVAAFVGMAVVTMPLGWLSSAWLLALSLFVIFGLDTVMDAAMNTHGVRVQKAYGRSILNSFHAWWSVGAVAGSALAALTAAVGLPLGPYLLVLSIALLAVALFAGAWALPGPDPHTHLDTEGEGSATDASSSAGPSPASSWRAVLRWAVLALGLFIMLAVIVEDVPARWSSVYLADAGATGGLVSMGLVAFTAAMALGRFVGDRFVERWGDVAVTRWGMGVSAVVLALALVQGGIAAFLIACLVAGFGVATLFPSAIHAGAHLPGVRPATGVAVVSWASRLGAVTAPIVVGLVADSAGIAWGVGLAVLAAVGLVPLARVLRQRS